MAFSAYLSDFNTPVTVRHLDCFRSVKDQARTALARWVLQEPLSVSRDRGVKSRWPAGTELTVALDTADDVALLAAVPPDTLLRAWRRPSGDATLPATGSVGAGYTLHCFTLDGRRLTAHGVVRTQSLEDVAAQLEDCVAHALPVASTLPTANDPALAAAHTVAVTTLAVALFQALRTPGAPQPLPLRLPEGGCRPDVDPDV